ncbi:MAG: adenosylcobinamide-GDP ribazoletransferase [Proteobacteria bacterium]|nr:adenosylcobinamide-GDP ribazoletransferase [Pseudomonadota bacterium]MBU6424808.1 adenosylcobinamide-GDP ribazoletransferase [Rhodospirillales bacterium]
MRQARRRWDEARLAFMLLSRLPMGRMDVPPAMADAVWAYPLVGLAVGAVSGLVFGLTAWGGLPPLAAALLAVGASAGLTGAMHEDGLADLADGFGGGRDKAHKLEIMRDSRTGSYGVVALVLVLGLRVACLAALPALGMVMRLAAIGALSRALLPVVMLALPPAREDGLGQAVGSQLALGSALAGLMLAGVAALLLLPSLPVVAVMALAAVGVCVLAKRQIGGFTGDVLGSVQVLAETAGLCALAVQFHP